MSEQQLRDVLARVVPEPPDSVADAGPVVRVARRRRRVRVAGFGAIAAVLVAGTVVGLRAFRTDDTPVETLQQDVPGIADPYTTAPCPDAHQPWDVAPLTDLNTVTAVRFCNRDVNGFDGPAGPPDALVVNISAFTDAVAAIAPADPARCAATDPTPTDNRLLVQLADGSVVGVPAGFCQDATVGGRTLDGGDLSTAFLTALSAQRASNDYAVASDEPASCSAAFSDISPASPGVERLVSGTVCGGDAVQPAELSPARLTVLQRAWDAAGKRPIDTRPCGVPDSSVQLFVRTDRGDNLQLDGSCGYLAYYASDGTTYYLDLKLSELLG